MHQKNIIRKIILILSSLALAIVLAQVSCAAQTKEKQKCKNRSDEICISRKEDMAAHRSALEKTLVPAGLRNRTTVSMIRFAGTFLFVFLSICTKVTRKKQKGKKGKEKMP